MKNQEIKRLFFAVEVKAPWPTSLPEGRLLEEESRHITLDFLGNIPFQPLLRILKDFPKYPASFGTAGYFDECLFLPHNHPHVVAWHAKWLDESDSFFSYQITLSQWLSSHGFAIDSRPWMPHLTLCRSPFNRVEWLKIFTPLPFYTGSIHLFESLGNLQYRPIWTLPIQPPFEEIEHTADMAFIVRGSSLNQLFRNAFIALAFKVPHLLQYFVLKNALNNLDEVIIALNSIIGYADGEVGVPLKAVSFHGDIVTNVDHSIQWEMIVDV